MSDQLDHQLISSIVNMMDRLCDLSINYIGDNTSDSALSDLEEAIYDARRLSDKFTDN